eukprot:GHVT01073180.1.p1 GENE.GHVT01073180.1~~GHVT01073180.1.p1  ORF type:complete len:250 (-),score=65.30 GHVT01073180.1:327-1076(-)
MARLRISRVFEEGQEEERSACEMDCRGAGSQADPPAPTPTTDATSPIEDSHANFHPARARGNAQNLQNLRGTIRQLAETDQQTGDRQLFDMLKKHQREKEREKRKGKGTETGKPHQQTKPYDAQRGCRGKSKYAINYRERRITNVAQQINSFVYPSSLATSSSSSSFSTSSTSSSCPSSSSSRPLPGRPCDCRSLHALRHLFHSFLSAPFDSSSDWRPTLGHDEGYKAAKKLLEAIVRTKTSYVNCRAL